MVSKTERVTGENKILTILSDLQMDKVDLLIALQAIEQYVKKSNKHYTDQIDRLAKYILNNHSDKITDNGACDVAVEIMTSQEQHVIKARIETHKLYLNSIEEDGMVMMSEFKNGMNKIVNDRIAELKRLEKGLDGKIHA